VQLINAFDDFMKNHINLAETRIDRLDGHVSAVHTFLSGGSGDIAEKFVSLMPQGSYAQGTIINPVANNDEFDADVLLQLEEIDGWDAEDYVESVYHRFRESGTYRDKVSRRTRCVVVNYAGDFHMDVVPYLIRAGDAYITNRRDNVFERTNPEGFNEWLDGQNRVTGGQLVKVIRLGKYLRDFKNTFSVPSVILSILLGQRVSSTALWSDPDHYKNLPTALVNVFADLSAYLQLNPVMPYIEDPSCAGESFNHRWQQGLYENFCNQIKTYATWMREAYDETNREASYEKWQRVFGSEFGAVLAGVSLAASAPDRTGVATAQDIQADLGIPIQLDPSVSVRLIGRVRSAGVLRAYDLPQRGNSVGKNRTIDFSIANCTVREPYDIYWKVRNTGREAADANALRGQIKQDGGSMSRWESTSYLGRHYVDVYVVKNGKCVARDRQLVIVKR
jgi:hypothetical protein